MSALQNGAPVIAPGALMGALRGLRTVTDRCSRVAAPITAVLLGLVAWQVLSVTSGGWLPSLGKTASAAGTVLGSETLVSDILTTLRRVLIVWAASVAIGLVVGVAAGFSWRFRAFLRPVLAIALAIPDLVYIIMVVLVLGTAESSGLIALVLAIVPLVINVVMASVIERDRGLDEMATAYRLPTPAYFAHVLWWQLRPAAVSGTRTAFAFSWKLMVLMEAINQPDGVGARIAEAFNFLRPADMIVYAILFTILMKAIEVVVVDRLLTGRRGTTSAGSR